MINESLIKALEATSKKQTIACVDSLFLAINPIRLGGNKGFVGRTRIPPGRKGKQIDVRIDTYGKGFNEWSLKAQGRNGTAFAYGQRRQARIQVTSTRKSAHQVKK